MAIGARRLSRAHKTALHYDQPSKARPALPNLQGAQGKIACPDCGAEVTLRYANTEYQDWNVARDDVVVSNHAVGGGKLVRGRVRCRASGRNAIDIREQT